MLQSSRHRHIRPDPRASKIQNRPYPKPAKPNPKPLRAAQKKVSLQIPPSSASLPRTQPSQPHPNRLLPRKEPLAQPPADLLPRQRIKLEQCVQFRGQSDEPLWYLRVAL